MYNPSFNRFYNNLTATSSYVELNRLPSPLRFRAPETEPLFINVARTQTKR